MNNEIYLRRKQKVYFSKLNERTNLSDTFLATALKNLESLGYTLSKNLINILRNYKAEHIKNIYMFLISNISLMLGANVKYRPMYPNFPEQVMEADIVELYINAVIHYVSGGVLLPFYEKKERLPLIENTSLKVIDLGSKKDFDSIFENLLNSKTSLSESDREDLDWFVSSNFLKIKDILPEEIPLKENVAFLSKLLFKYVKKPQEYLCKYYKTATDVLRFAVELSDGDVSLKDDTKFRNFSRKERRMILGLLNKCKNIEEDMLRYRNKWICLGEKLHPFEYKNRYYKAAVAFDKIRNKKKIKTFNSEIKKLIKVKDYLGATKLLSKRPGEFARSLDLLLRSSDNNLVIINSFKNVAHNVSSNVLLQVMTHFMNRNNKSEVRAFFPKGNVAKMFTIDNTLLEIKKFSCDYIVKICENALIQKYSKGNILGKVYIDKELKNFTVPFSQRSASKSLRTISRGSKLNFDKNSEVLRAFLYWEDGCERTDIDLSATMYDSNWDYLSHISYTNLREREYGCCHSGDITSAPNGASEFIDLDLNKTKNNDIRYIIVSMHSFTKQPFCDLPACFMGWQTRKNSNMGEIFEPKTVKQKVDIASDTKICIPLIIDLFDGKIIWTDLALQRQLNLRNNIESNNNNMVKVAKAMCGLVKPNLYDLFMLHARARGFITDNPSEADMIFSNDGDITPYDTDIIMGQYL